MGRWEPQFDKGKPVLEPSARLHFANEGTFSATIGEVLVRAGALKSKREVRERHGKMRVAIVCASGSQSTFPIFATRDLLSKFEWWPGDVLSVNELFSAIEVHPPVVDVVA